MLLNSISTKSAQNESTHQRGLAQPNRTIETSAHYGATPNVRLCLARLSPRCKFADVRANMSLCLFPVSSVRNGCTGIKHETKVVKKSQTNASKKNNAIERSVFMLFYKK